MKQTLLLIAAKRLPATAFRNTAALLCVAALLSLVPPSPGSEAYQGTYSESDAARRLDRLLSSQNLSADVFVADVDGNGVPDFVVRLVGGGGTVWAKVEKNLGPEQRQGILAADFSITALGGIFVMQKEYLPWKVDKIYLDTSEAMRIVPSGNLSECAAAEKDSLKWRACLIRAYVHEDTVSREQVQLAALLQKPLPPNGFTVRSHKGEAAAALPIRADASGLHYLVTFAESPGDETVAVVFMRSGEGVATKLPSGSYRISYAVGADWHGSEKLFGPSTKCFAVTDVVQVLEGSKAEFLLSTRADSAEPLRRLFEADLLKVLHPAAVKEVQCRK